MIRLTRLAQAAVRERLVPGAFAVDATAGNGHDTVFLAEAVGPTGRVLAVDIQPAAIRSTRARLDEQGLGRRVELVEGCHSALEDRLPEAPPVRAAMFNLGYLPGSDKQAITGVETTSRALDACLRHLDGEGIVSVMAYRGHPGGAEETTAVAALVEALPAERYATERHDAPGDGPVLWLLRRS